MEDYLKATESLPLATIRLYAAYHLKFMANKRRQAKNAYTPEAAQRKREYYIRKKLERALISDAFEAPDAAELTIETLALGASSSLD